MRLYYPIEVGIRHRANADSSSSAGCAFYYGYERFYKGNKIVYDLGVTDRNLLEKLGMVPKKRQVPGGASNEPSMEEKVRGWLEAATLLPPKGSRNQNPPPSNDTPPK